MTMDLIKVLPFTCTVGNQGFTVTVSHLLVGRTAGIIKRFFEQKQENGQSLVKRGKDIIIWEQRAENSTSQGI